MSRAGHDVEGFAERAFLLALGDLSPDQPAR